MNARSVLECGGPPPRSERPAHRARPQSARGLADPKTWRHATAPWSAATRRRFPTGRHVCQFQSADLSAHSRTWRLGLAFLAWLLLAGAALAQSYSIDWSKVAGGGGTSTGGVYAVSGTIGQPEASGPLTNGQFAVTGGFWALPVAIQTPEAPVLSITAAAPGQVRISWTPPTPGFTLQATDSLAPTNWGAAPSGTNNPAMVPASAAARFYRLMKAGP